MKMQPSSDMVEAERTTTTTLPAMLTRAPRPAPTIIWASWTMQVRAAQSTPVPRSISLLPRSCSRSWGGRGRFNERMEARKRSLMTHLRNSLLTSNLDKVSTEFVGIIKHSCFAIKFRTTAGNSWFKHQIKTQCLHHILEKSGLKHLSGVSGDIKITVRWSVPCIHSIKLPGSWHC